MYTTEGYLHNRHGVLYVERVSTLTLARKFSTPLYVYSAGRIRENYERLRNAFVKHYPRFRIHYSVKANDNLAILRLLRKIGAGADCSSPSEIFLAERAGIKDIFYSGIYYRDDEIEYGVRHGAVINLDSSNKVGVLKRAGYRGPVCFRVNPGIGKGRFKEIVTGGKTAKFGIVESEIVGAYRHAKKLGFKRFGIHAMTGSGILDETYFAKATRLLLDIAGKISKSAGIAFDFINIGGGFGIPYERGERPLNMDRVARGVVQVLRKKLKEYNLGEPALFVEPGRYIVGDAGVLLTRVTDLKEKPKKFVGVDAGMHTLLRPMLYGAHHPIYTANRLNARVVQRADVVGPICESADVLAKQRALPRLKQGDLLAILCTGAYGFSMSSTYGGRPRPAEVLVDGGKYVVIRERPSLKSLLDYQLK